MEFSLEHTYTYTYKYMLYKFGNLYSHRTTSFLEKVHLQAFNKLFIFPEFHSEHCHRIRVKKI